MSKRIERLNEVKKTAEMMIGVMSRKEEKFVEDFKANPASAFEWSGNVVACAAGRECWENILELAEKAIESTTELDFDWLVNRVTREALRKASSGSRSTSASSNHMARERIEAWADAAIRLRNDDF